MTSNEATTQYCFNPKTKEIVEGSVPPTDDFVPIIGYFEKNSDPEILKQKIEEIFSHQESALDYDEYEGEEPEEPVEEQSQGN